MDLFQQNIYEWAHGKRKGAQLIYRDPGGFCCCKGKGEGLGGLNWIKGEGPSGVKTEGQISRVSGGRGN